MEIKTKFNIGDIVFFYNKGELLHSTIENINVSQRRECRALITYKIHHIEDIFVERELFKTPEDFFKNVKIEELQ